MSTETPPPASAADRDTASVGQQLLAAFNAVADVPLAQREAAIEALGLECPELERELRALLDRDAETGPLDASLSGQIQPLLREALPELDPAPAQIGPYAVLRLLGEGGMGRVYLARRSDGPVSRDVAIKLIRPDRAGAGLLARFEAERRHLAALDHPGICRFIDADSLADGTPYVVMEAVQGEPIIDFCQRHSLGLRARVELLSKLLAAVDYAHRHLVLHRDIKPGNVLVNAEGQTKLIDFGIAKTLSGDSPELTIEQSPLTPRYAAPEQLRGERPSTATDQWQLAALAFELLCGSPLRNEIGIECASRRALAAPAEHLAACGLDAAALARRLRGDLDAILGKALSQDPGARYGSIDAFASDVRAWLDARPVAVRRHERWYAGLRFVNQHRWALGFASVALLAVVGAAVIAIVLGERAREQAQVAERTSDLLLDVFLDQPANSFSLASMSLADFFSRVVDLSIQSEDIPAATRSRLLKTLSVRSMEVGAEKASVLAAQEGTRLVEEQFGRDSVEVARALDHQARVTLHSQGSAAAAGMQALLERSGGIHASS
jgi:hypothetical protein